MQAKSWTTTALFLLLVLGGGFGIGLLTLPDGWYAHLAKPAFNPPNWLFGPVWTVIYILIAIAGQRTWARDTGGWAMRLWWVQLVTNFLWTPLFFRAHLIGAALADIALTLGLILGFIVVSARKDSWATGLFVPYAAWVGFATALNGGVFLLNR